MATKVYLLSFFLFSCLFIIPFGCDNSNGLFGRSDTKEEARSRGSNVTEYLPDKTNVILLTGKKMRIDTAWAEISFTYKEGKKISDSTYGYNFTIPFTEEVHTKYNFPFSFGLADSSNRMFTNGMGLKECQLRPIYLFDTMKVLLEQKNPDTSLGWLKPIITDTITFVKIK
jgi:hypothetical protein